jgi:hypothetical protein
MIQNSDGGLLADTISRTIPRQWSPTAHNHHLVLDLTSRTLMEQRITTNILLTSFNDTDILVWRQPNCSLHKRLLRRTSYSRHKKKLRLLLPTRCCKPVPIQKNLKLIFPRSLLLSLAVSLYPLGLYWRRYDNVGNILYSILFMCYFQFNYCFLILTPEAQRYKPGGRGFDSRWCQWIFLSA